MKKYYVAYGSNLNKSQMKRRCPNAIPVTSGVLKDYELIFKGSKSGSYATIEPKKGASVPVGVWFIDGTDEYRLDQYEGYPFFYYKTNVDVETEYGTIEAMVYITHEDRPYGVPTDAYVDVCLAGYDDFGLDKLAFLDAFLSSLQKVSVDD